MAEEIWKQIPFANAYEVSSYGRIRKGETIRRIIKNNKGYLVVSLCRNGSKPRQELVHRLVAKTFIPNPDNKLHVNHLDSDPSNARLENLEWCTPLENVRHAMKFGTYTTRKNELNPKARLNRYQVQRVRLMKEISPLLACKTIGKMFGVSRSCIRDVIFSVTWKHI